MVKKVKGVLRFNIKKADGKETWWIVDAKNGGGALKYRGTGRKHKECCFRSVLS